MVNADTIVLVCHVILKDHMTEGSSAFMDERRSVFVTILPRFVAIGTVVLEM